MLRKLRRRIINIRIAINHAAYHRYLRKAIKCQQTKDLHGFKRNIYKSEDAWRIVAYLTEKLQQL